MHEFGPTGLSNGVPVNHLWFIVYIAVYSLVAVALMTRPALMERLEGWLVRATAGWRVLVVPIAYLIVIRIVLFPLFGITNRLSWDGYNHFLSLGAFLFGFLMVRHEGLWAGLERHRRTAAIVALIALPIMMAQAAHPGGATWFGIPRAIVFGIDQWAVIAAILGYRQPLSETGLGTGPAVSGGRDLHALPRASDGAGRGRLVHPARQSARRAGSGGPGRHHLWRQPADL